MNTYRFRERDGVFDGYGEMTPTYRAQCGRRHEFLSQSDADAYDDGYNTYYPISLCMHGPYAQGWHDREQDQQDRDDARVERYLRETE